MNIVSIDVGRIAPSPYQNRKHFAQDALSQLAESIKRDGLVEPIVVRPMGDGYELIAGERRLRATRTFARSIMARVVDADDLQARRMCAAENMQRADLSAVEEIWCLVEMVDAEMAADPDYLALGAEPVERVKRLLVAMDSDRRRGSTNVSGKFTGRTEAIFSGLPKPKDWESFLRNDLPIITSIDAEVLDVAIENRLNKSQTKALAEMAKTAPEVLKKLVDSASDGEIAVKVRADDGCVEQVPLHELSARDISTVALFGADALAAKPLPLESLMTGDMEGYTPAEYVEAAREVMGSIDVDPASNALAQEVVRATVHYTAATNGLDKEWHGNVFLNPPYNAGLIDQFLDKLISEHQAGRTKQAVLLTNNNTDTNWFHTTARAADLLCLTRGRIHFYKPDRSTVAPVNGQAFFYFGPNRRKFAEVFSRIGLVVERA